MQGEFHWHKHDEQDEFFFVLDGLFRIELDGTETVELGPRQAFAVPAGMLHRPVVPVRSAVSIRRTIPAQLRQAARPGHPPSPMTGAMSRSLSSCSSCRRRVGRSDGHTSMISTSSASPAKSVGLRVTSGRRSATATDAMSRSANRLRGVRPWPRTAA